MLFAMFTEAANAKVGQSFVTKFKYHIWEGLLPFSLEYFIVPSLLSKNAKIKVQGTAVLSVMCTGMKLGLQN